MIRPGRVPLPPGLHLCNNILGKGGTMSKRDQLRQSMSSMYSLQKQSKSEQKVPEKNCGLCKNYLETAFTGEGTGLLQDAEVELGYPCRSARLRSGRRRRITAASPSWTRQSANTTNAWSSWTKTAPNAMIPSTREPSGRC